MKGLTPVSMTSGRRPSVPTPSSAPAPTPTPTPSATPSSTTSGSSTVSTPIEKLVSFDGQTLSINGTDFIVERCLENGTLLRLKDNKFFSFKNYQIVRLIQYIGETFDIENLKDIKIEDYLIIDKYFAYDFHDVNVINNIYKYIMKEFSMHPFEMLFEEMYDEPDLKSKLNRIIKEDWQYKDNEKQLNSLASEFVTERDRTKKFMYLAQMFENLEKRKIIKD